MRESPYMTLDSVTSEADESHAGIAKNLPSYKTNTYSIDASQTWG